MTLGGRGRNPKRKAPTRPETLLPGPQVPAATPLAVVPLDAPPNCQCLFVAGRVLSQSTMAHTLECG